MADHRFGSVLAGGVGPDHRFGSVLYTANAVRTVGNISVDADEPGASYELPLGGTWDAGGKTITIGGLSVTPTAQDATSITFTVPTPYADGSAFALLNLNTPYDIIVDDTGAPVTKSSGFRIDAPPQPTYHYINSITGSPWDQSSLWYDSSNFANGDSAIVWLTRNSLSTLNSDGSWTAPDSVSMSAKGWNSTSGWSINWAEFVFDAVGDLPTVQEVVEASRGSGGSRRGRTDDMQIEHEDVIIRGVIEKFLKMVK